MSSKKLPNLSTILKIDAATCAVMALALLVWWAPIGALVRLPDDLLRGAGAVLIPCAILFGVAGSSARAARLLMPVLAVGNALWVVASLALLESGYIDPNPLGVALVLVQAGAVAVLAVAEFTGWRQMPQVRTWPEKQGEPK